jgi:hypothetical protein
MEDRRLRGAACLIEDSYQRGSRRCRGGPLNPRPAPCAFGRASLTLRFRPLKLVPFRAAIARPLSRVRHFDKGKAACAARGSVGYQVDPLHFSIRLEDCAEGRFGSTEIQISYKDVFHVVKRWSFNRAGETRPIGYSQVVAERSKA